MATPPYTDDEGSGSGVAPAPGASKSECRSLDACPTLHGIADSCYVSDHDHTQHQYSHARYGARHDDEWGWEYDGSGAASNMASSGGSGDGSEFNIDYSCYDPYGPSGSGVNAASKMLKAQVRDALARANLALRLLYKL